MNDFVPKADADFNNWQNSLMTDVNANAKIWLIPEDDLAPVKSLQLRWVDAFAKTSNKQNRTSADVQLKKEVREEYEKEIRKMVRQWLANNSRVTDADRTRMGLTVKTGTRTPVAIPSTSPMATIDFSVRLQHKIEFFDEASAHSNAKPDGVHGCEIFVKVDGEAPKSVDEMTYLGTCTASPFVAKYDGTKSGKTAWYWLRWINSRAEAGPWSVVVSAMIVG